MNHKQHAWTARETTELVRLREAEGMQWGDIGEVFNVSGHAANQAYRRELKRQGRIVKAKYKRWTREEVAFLRKARLQTPPMKYDEIARRLARHVESVKAKAAQEGLRSKEVRQSTKEIVEKCVFEFRLTIEQTANRVGISEEYVRRLIAYG